MSNNQILISLVILIGLSAFFSATETAFSSLNKIKIKSLANDGDRKALKVLRLAEDFPSLLSTVLIGNNIVNILASSLATLFFVNLIGKESGVALASIVMTVVVLIFGEITPKAIAKELPERYAMFASPIVKVLKILLSPLNLFFNSIQKIICFFFNVENAESFSSEEFITIVEEAHSDGGMDDHEADLLTNAIEFNDLEVKDILTPRVDVIACDQNTGIEEIEKLYRENGFSRLPIYDGNIDNIIGVLHEKDFYNIYYTKSKRPIKEILQNVNYTSPHIKVSALLRQLQSSKSHMAVVIDEYGGTAGIITMEDILEELVGEIYDEHDEVEELYHKIDDHTYSVCGDMDIDDMFELFGIENKEEFDFVTTSGWVIHNCDRIPEVGTEFDYKNLHITVTAADNKVVNAIKVVIKDEHEEKHAEKSSQK